MTTDEREAIYEHCARLAEEWVKMTNSEHVKLSMHKLADLIREHKADPVKYP